MSGYGIGELGSILNRGRKVSRRCSKSVPNYLRYKTDIFNSRDVLSRFGVIGCSTEHVSGEDSSLTEIFLQVHCYRPKETRD